MKLFVYGTLKKGKGNHYLLEHETFIDDDCVPGKLYVQGIPYAMEHHEGKIKGEIYEVSEETLFAVDRLEGHPNWYRRTPAITEKGHDVQVYYADPPEMARLIESGEY